MKVLWVGDVYGSRGLEALDKFLPDLKRDLGFHILLINGENMADGLGIKAADYKALMAMGAHMVTLGNHGFSKRDVLAFIEEGNLVRPLNYPPGTPGKGVRIINYNGAKIAVMSVMGRVFMHDPLDNPFVALDQALAHLDADYILVEVHAEATSEKLAIAHYLDGRVSAVVGTHTHVQTNDAMRLPKGTSYMTDLGMTGVKYGILGADRQCVMQKFLTGMPVRLRPSEDSALQLNAALLDLESGRILPIHKSD